MKTQFLLILLSGFFILSCSTKKEEPKPSSNNDDCKYSFTKSNNTYIPITSPDGFYDGYNSIGKDHDISLSFPITIMNKTSNTIKSIGLDNLILFDKSDWDSSPAKIGERVMIKYEMDQGSGAPYYSWKTEGGVPNRIFKMQLTYTNANPDQINMQLWFYETSNKIEVHYGNNNALKDDSQYYMILAHEDEPNNILEVVSLNGSTDSPSPYCGNASSAEKFAMVTSSVQSKFLKGKINSGLTYTFIP